MNDDHDTSGTNDTEQIENVLTMISQIKHPENDPDFLAKRKEFFTEFVSETLNSCKKFDIKGHQRVDFAQMIVDTIAKAFDTGTHEGTVFMSEQFINLMSSLEDVMNSDFENQDNIPMMKGNTHVH